MKLIHNSAPPINKLKTKWVDFSNAWSVQDESLINHGDPNEPLLLKSTQNCKLTVPMIVGDSAFTIYYRVSDDELEKVGLVIDPIAGFSIVTLYNSIIQTPNVWFEGADYITPGEELEVSILVDGRDHTIIINGDVRMTHIDSHDSEATNIIFSDSSNSLKYTISRFKIETPNAGEVRGFNPDKPDVLFHDTFLDSGGTLVRDHIPQIDTFGEGWTDVNASWTIAINDARNTGKVDDLLGFDAVSDFKLLLKYAPGDGNYYITYREVIDPDAPFWRFKLDVTTSNVTLEKFGFAESEPAMTVATGTIPYLNERTRFEWTDPPQIEINVKGYTHEFWFDGVMLISHTDLFNTTGTFLSFRDSEYTEYAGELKEIELLIHPDDLTSTNIYLLDLFEDTDNININTHEPDIRTLPESWDDRSLGGTAWGIVNNKLTRLNTGEPAPLRLEDVPQNFKLNIDSILINEGFIIRYRGDEYEGMFQGWEFEFKYTVIGGFNFKWFEIEQDATILDGIQIPESQFMETIDLELRVADDQHALYINNVMVAQHASTDGIRSGYIEFENTHGLGEFCIIDRITVSSLDDISDKLYFYDSFTESTNNYPIANHQADVNLFSNDWSVSPFSSWYVSNNKDAYSPTSTGTMRLDIEVPQVCIEMDVTIGANELWIRHDWDNETNSGYQIDIPFGPTIQISSWENGVALNTLGSISTPLDGTWSIGEVVKVTINYLPEIGYEFYMDDKLQYRYYDTQFRRMGSLEFEASSTVAPWWSVDNVKLTSPKPHDIILLDKFEDVRSTSLADHSPNFHLPNVEYGGTLSNYIMESAPPESHLTDATCLRMRADVEGFTINGLEQTNHEGGYQIDFILKLSTGIFTCFYQRETLGIEGHWRIEVDPSRGRVQVSNNTLTAPYTDGDSIRSDATLYITIKVDGNHHIVEVNGNKEIDIESDEYPGRNHPISCESNGGLTYIYQLGIENYTWEEEVIISDEVVGDSFLTVSGILEDGYTMANGRYNETGHSINGYPYYKLDDEGPFGIYIWCNGDMWMLSGMSGAEVPIEGGNLPAEAVAWTYTPDIGMPVEGTYRSTETEWSDAIVVYNSGEISMEPFFLSSVDGQIANPCAIGTVNDCDNCTENCDGTCNCVGSLANGCGSCQECSCNNDCSDCNPNEELQV